MGRFCRLLVISALLALALPIYAQEPTSPSNPDSALRVPPPSENATAAELEQQGDALRGQKAYLDSIDYYRAAIKKGESAVLHNKVGICLLLLRRDSEARKEFQRSITTNLPAYAKTPISSRSCARSSRPPRTVIDSRPKESDRLMAAAPTVAESPRAKPLTPGSESGWRGCVKNSPLLICAVFSTFRDMFFKKYFHSSKAVPGRNKTLF